MAKKTNRPKSKTTTRPAARQPVVETPAPVEETVAATTTAAPAAPRAPRPPKLNRSQVAAERLEDEYAYIADDLRRVFILAAAMFILLIALNIIFDMIA